MEISSEKYIANLKLVIRNLPSQVERILQSRKTEVLDLNRQNQLFERGVDSKGSRLKDYAFFTIQIKRQLGQPTDRTTLFYSGKFYEGFRYEFNQQTYVLSIFSTDSKTPLLIEKYGEDIFGLDAENKEYLDINIIKPDLDAWILRYL